MKEALRLAWKANPNLQISRLQALIAGEEVVRARSGFLPQVKTQVGQTIYDDPLKFSFSAARARSFPQTNRNFWSSQTSFTSPSSTSGAPRPGTGRGPGNSASLLDTAKTRDDIFLIVSQGYFRTLGPEDGDRGPAGGRDLKAHLKIARDHTGRGGHLQRPAPGRGLPVRRPTASHRRRHRRGQSPSALNKLLGLPISAATALKDEADLRPWALEEATHGPETAEPT